MNDMTAPTSNPAPGDDTPRNAARDAAFDSACDSALRTAVSDAVLAHLSETPFDSEIPSSPPELWPAIEARLASRQADRDVIPLHAASSARTRRRTFPQWVTMLAAASLLIVATAGITYVVTVRNLGSQQSQFAQAASNVPQSRSAESPNTNDNVQLQTTPGSGYRTPVVQVTNNNAWPPQGGNPDMYDKEIDELQTVVKEKRAQLKPETVKTIEQNLKVIDEAIRQSQAALAKDTASKFLNQQLDRARAKKIALLRTAALLPPSA